MNGAQLCDVQIKSDMKFNPSINGFSIKSVQTMPSEDGYACYCKLFFRGRMIGEFVDKGDGGEYSFYANKPFSSIKIERVVRSFPHITRDYGFGDMDVEYDIGILVSDLMEMNDIAKKIKKLEPLGKGYVRIDDWTADKHVAATVLNSMTDDELEKSLTKGLASRGMSKYEIRRYRTQTDLCIVNMTINESDLIK